MAAQGAQPTSYCHTTARGLVEECVVACRAAGERKRADCGRARRPTLFSFSRAPRPRIRRHGGDHGIDPAATTASYRSTSWCLAASPQLQNSQDTATAASPSPWPLRQVVFLQLCAQTTSI